MLMKGSGMFLGSKLGDSSVGKVPVMQARGPESHHQDARKSQEQTVPAPVCAHCAGRRGRFGLTGQPFCPNW